MVVYKSLLPMNQISKDCFIAILIISELYIVMQKVAESRNRLQRPINLHHYRVMI